MYKMKPLISILLLFVSCFILAQTDSTKAITYSGYAELYYSYDLAKPSNHEKANFLYNHKRHNELNVNLAYIKANYNKDNVRANIALMVGNYAQYNLSAESTWSQFVYEANVGLKLSKKSNTWLDAGIMPSHIGFESAISADCWTLSRSILAENSPYFETGIKLSHLSKNEKWNTAFLVLNGWQRIRKPDYIQNPSLGVQINYKPNNKLTLNYSNFIGSDKPDSVKATRIFHNIFAIYEATSKFAITAGFDIGSDKISNNENGLWYSPVLIARYTIDSKNKVALRLESYQDKNQIIITTNTFNGFNTIGSSINHDFAIKGNVLWRNEIKMFQSKDKIFEDKNSNFSYTTSLSIKI
jgi:hypothetical protein